MGRYGFPLLASGPREAGSSVHRCRCCGQIVRPGQRIADLPDGGVIHVSACAAQWGAKVPAVTR